MFRKILIANRGEIAVRIIRACRDLGIATVAVYSDADRASLHVRLADEAYRIGPAPAAESYLQIDRIIATAKQAGAEAIHPGYGFLSENAEFAARCQDAGIVFIGPPAAAMRAMGEKTAARRAVEAVGVPVVPGMREPLTSLDEARAAAEQIGYPVLLKAAGGGGGKGMRLVRTPDELAAAIRAASSEARSAFGDGSVYLEHYVDPARHVEAQIFADAHGNVVFLGERECSIQRRHQKIIEESPSPAVTPAIRRALGEAAIRAARAVGYTNAGTVEFVLDSQGRFYFLEMNTRLQVEHPDTEMDTGLDLVQLQIRVAAGEPLPFTQAEIQPRGWAIECRIYAEDPLNQFLPSTGTIVALQEPTGPWVRVDSGAYEGMEVPIHYDPILAKVIAWGPDRPTAIARMQRALAEYQIVGVQTTIPFHQFALAHPRFVAGQIDTGFVAAEWTGEPSRRSATGTADDVAQLGDESTSDSGVVAALAATLAAHDQRRRTAIGAASGINGRREQSRWRDAARLALFRP